jgi:hypothetical protein
MNARGSPGTETILPQQINRKRAGTGHDRDIDLRRCHTIGA